MDGNSTLLFGVLGAIAIVIVLLSVRRRREAIRNYLRHIAISIAVYLIVIVIAVEKGLTGLAPIVWGLVSALAAQALFPQKRRTRYVRKHERKKAIAEFERRTGQKFNKRIHELDHEVPFSRGGNSTADNLRVLEKDLNRLKGAKSPWWDILGR
ncbi:MAG TPA: HNH endonuclease signature motif containing protein [Candidatus Acidoferrum sp.]|nr:HNH endonuclease signature motif containing protein [Candidatus Acidoferrum sp.]